jgi:hypothetical protein
MSHVLLQHPLLLILCLRDLPPLAQYSLPLPLCVCVIVCAETGVLESEQIPTSCYLFHNQDLYKYSALPLPHNRIIIPAQSVHVLAVCYCSDPAILFSLPDAVFLSATVLPALTLVPVSCPKSRHRAPLSWIPHSTTPLNSPPDLLTLSQPLSLQPQPPHLVSSSPPKIPLTSFHLPLGFSKYLGYFIPVSSSESALGFPCFTLLNKPQSESIVLWPRIY